MIYWPSWSREAVQDAVDEDVHGVDGEVTEAANDVSVRERTERRPRKARGDGMGIGCVTSIQIWIP